MSTLDDRFRALAKRLVAGFGAPVTVTRVVEGAYNSTTGTLSKTTTVAAAYAIVDAYGMAEFRDGSVERTDKRLYVAATALTFTPQPADTLTLDSTVHTIISVAEIWSGAQRCLYDLQVRA